MHPYSAVVAPLVTLTPIHLPYTDYRRLSIWRASICLVRDCHFGAIIPSRYGARGLPVHISDTRELPLRFSRNEASIARCSAVIPNRVSLDPTPCRPVVRKFQFMHQIGVSQGDRSDFDSYQKGFRKKFPHTSIHAKEGLSYFDSYQNGSRM